ncbi:MAG TPA: OsmC family protein [Gammaproteobacteria bacterium]|nr:OsmC family protein [Gammaproteobacteria bacterium]
MDAKALRELQAPLKDKYRFAPEAAGITLTAQGELDAEGVSCRVETGKALVEAGLHPATGGDGQLACSGNMLLEALVACAGVTLRAVATALEIDVRRGRVYAEGDLDFRGTLGLDKAVPVGFKAIRLRFDVDSDAGPEQLETLQKLTERYCVVYQTLKSAPPVAVELLSGNPA